MQKADGVFSWRLRKWVLPSCPWKRESSLFDRSANPGSPLQGNDAFWHAGHYWWTFKKK